MHAGGQQVGQLPGVRLHHLGRDAGGRQGGEDGECAVAAAGGAAVDQPAHEGAQADHIEGLVLELDDQVVVGGPGGRHTGLVGEDRGALAEGRLVLLEQLDEPVDARHVASSAAVWSDAGATGRGYIDLREKNRKLADKQRGIPYPTENGSQPFT